MKTSVILIMQSGAKKRELVLGSRSQKKWNHNYLHPNIYYLDDDCLMVRSQIYINLAASNFSFFTARATQLAQYCPGCYQSNR